jgi:hypothetical protein
LGDETRHEVKDMMKKRNTETVLRGSVREVAQILAAGLLRMERNAMEPSKNDAAPRGRDNRKGGAK